MRHDFGMRLGSVRGDLGPKRHSEFGSGHRGLRVLAVVVWRAKLAQEGFAFQMQSDSTAALSATDKLAGKSVVTNFVAAELALRLEVMRVREVDVLHVPGVLNKTPDWPDKSGDSEPDCLKAVRRRPVPDRDSSLFVLPLPIPENKNLWDCAS